MNELLKKLKSPQGLKALLGVKLVIVLGIWISMDERWHVGDRSAAAETAKEPEKKAEAAKEAGKEAAKDEAKPAAKEDAPIRKSFLSNLLELPELNPETMQKDELGRYLEIAERKKRQTEERLDLMKKREDQLKGLEASIDDKLKRLDEERRYFAQTIQQEKDLKGERLTKLIALYSKMEPKKAAPVFEALDKDLVVELFKAMPQKQVTSLLEGMSPAKSVQLSEYYGRVRSTREYDLLKEMNASLRKEFDDCKGMPTAAAAAAPPPAAATPAPAQNR